MSTSFKQSRSIFSPPVSKILNRFLNRLGYDLMPRIAHNNKGVTPQSMQSHPLTALVRSRTVGPCAFACPIDEVVMLNGFGFGNSTWHPFSATLEQLTNAASLKYENSVLKDFYALWQPKDAAEAVADFRHPPSALCGKPAHGYHFTPWSPISLDEVIDEIRRYYAADYIEHDCPELQLEADGFKFHGPVSTALGQVEFERLKKIYKEISRTGYDRSFGDINVYILRRRKELKFICRGGVHRLAAMKALGHTYIPARLSPPYVVDIQDLDYWPQVESGQWDVESAERYFDHLFDFDARSWVRALGINSFAIKTSQPQSQA